MTAMSRELLCLMAEKMACRKLADAEGPRVPMALLPERFRMADAVFASQDGLAGACILAPGPGFGDRLASVLSGPKVFRHMYAILPEGTDRETAPSAWGIMRLGTNDAWLARKPKRLSVLASDLAGLLDAAAPGGPIRNGDCGMLAKTASRLLRARAVLWQCGMNGGMARVGGNA